VRCQADIVEVRVAFVEIPRLNYYQVSCNLITLPSGYKLILDIGEGSLAQLLRHFGPESEQELLRIKFVFISHMHADHHGGLVSLLHHLMKLRRKETFRVDNQLFILAPYQTKIYIQEQSALGWDIGSEEDWVTWIDLDRAEQFDIYAHAYRTKLAKASQACGVEEFQAVRVDHRCKSWGLIVIGKKEERKWKIV
jgi:ribonuclease Z